MITDHSKISHLQRQIRQHFSPYGGSEWSWFQRLWEFLGNDRHLGSGYCSNGKMGEKRKRRSIESPLEIQSNLTADINKPHIKSTHLSLFFINSHTHNTHTASGQVRTLLWFNEHKHQALKLMQWHLNRQEVIRACRTCRQQQQLPLTPRSMAYNLRV